MALAAPATHAPPPPGLRRRCKPAAARHPPRRAQRACRWSATGNSALQAQVRHISGQGPRHAAGPLALSCPSAALSLAPCVSVGRPRDPRPPAPQLTAAAAAPGPSLPPSPARPASWRACPGRRQRHRRRRAELAAGRPHRQAVPGPPGLWLCAGPAARAAGVRGRVFRHPARARVCRRAAQRGDRGAQRRALAGARVRGGWWCGA